jgi:hypothetical protein
MCLCDREVKEERERERERERESHIKRNHCKNIWCDKNVQFAVNKRIIRRIKSIPALLYPTHSICSKL